MDLLTSESDHHFQPTHSSTAELKFFARLVLAPFVVIYDKAIEAAARLVRRRSLVREHLRGDDPLCDSGKVAVYVHFDTKGAIPDYIIHQLSELMDAGFRITFVSNAPFLPESSRALVRPFCKDIIWRHNTGYDFGAYKDGIASLGNLDQIDTLALMNDSIYGPFWKLSETLSAIDRSKYDFWGIVDSWEQQRYHLQTFFIVFFAKALRSSAFKTFWRTYPYVNNKGWVIRNGEIRLTQVLARHHMRSGALATYWSVAETMKDRLAASESTTRTPVNQAFQCASANGAADGPADQLHAFLLGRANLRLQMSVHQAGASQGQPCGYPDYPPMGGAHRVEYSIRCLANPTAPQSVVRINF